jgi:DNA-binding LacI/PurR family transcriptional regulator
VVSIDAHGARKADSAVTNIGLDEELGGRLMVEHLVELGYDQILVCAPMDYGNDRNRWLGARAAWEALGERAAGKRLGHVIMGLQQDEREQCYRDIARQMRAGRKTALFFMSDYLAMEAISYLASIGIHAPEDVGIAGFDDILFAGKFAVPRLTTIRQDIRAKAERAVDEMVAALDHPERPAREITLPVTLVRRQSV